MVREEFVFFGWGHGWVNAAQAARCSESLREIKVGGVLVTEGGGGM